MYARILSPIRLFKPISRLAFTAFLAFTLLFSSLAFTTPLAQASQASGASPQSASLLADSYCIDYHRVKYGETIYTIARRYGVPWRAIADANDIANPNRLYVGQVLCIPADYVSTSAKYIQALVDVNIRNGPGNNFNKIGVLYAGEIARVTGKSYNGDWWRIVCPNGRVGECYVTANSNYTRVYRGDTQPRPVAVTNAIPTFRILSVSKDNSVRIKTGVFLDREQLTVRMGKIGTKGVGGVVVATFTAPRNSSLEATLPIPSSLYGQERIAIRLEGKSGYVAYNSFWNK